MGKKTKGDRKTKSGRHEEEEEDDYMTDMTDQCQPQPDISFNSSANKVERVGQDDKQIDIFLDGIQNLDNKKAQSRLSGLKNVIGSLQSGVDLFDRASANMDVLTLNLKRMLTRRTSDKEVVLATQAISILALVAGAENDDFVREFFTSLVNLATKSNEEDLDVRVAAVRTLAFVDLVCGGGGSGISYVSFGVLGDIAMLQSEGTDVCPDLQAAAAEAWCLLAPQLPPQNVCEVSLEQDLFKDLVELLDSTDTETKITAGQCLALLWEVADQVQPDVEAAVSATLLCDDDEVIGEALRLLQQVGKESAKKVNKKERKERKGALKSVADWVLEGVPPEDDVVRLQGAEVSVEGFGGRRLVESLRGVLRGGMQSCLRVYPVTRDMLGAEYMSFEEEGGESSRGDAAGGGGVRCEAFDKRFVRSQVGKMQSTHRRNQRADKESMQADCF